MNNSCVFIAVGGSWLNNSSVPSQFKALADRLVEKGVQVVLLVQGKMDEEKSVYPHIYNWPSKRPTKIQDALFLIKLINKYHPNCLITQFAATNIMVLIGWLMRIPFRIVWYHTLNTQLRLDWSDSQLKFLYLRERKRFIYRLATCIVPVSNAAKKDFEHTYRIYNKSKVFLNGLMNRLYESLCLASKENQLICVARFDHTKGHDVLIRAFRKVIVDVPGAKLILLGDGKLREQYENLVLELELNNSIKFLGRVSPDEVISQLRSSKLSVLPSRMDNCPLALIESLSECVPVVASKVGGIPEIVIDGVTGYLVEPEDEAGFASAITKILLDSNLQYEMSKNAKEDFLRRFEINKIIDDQVEWLQKIGVF
ncbi:glycosyltransferase family 4 protein [Levilinea saccharolytica]|uniref:glycosyltransferase family 4 protein n=1 Tax=Levilinea saccharolytica TaxID=229921 RepID=UPI0009462F7F|nr:glycosyltransferase family 4 protein [Levilinea saccharolytica]GAP18813.1 glycosyltransferase [Levilinea saccharolytica]